MAIAAIMLTVTIVFAFGCNKEKAPSVETTQATGVTSSTASIGGFVTSDGGCDVIERGICWSTNTNPDVSTNVSNAGQGLGSFSCTLTNLQSATTYYARAYACNSVGVSYGAQMSFTTLSSGGGGGNAPTGAINGKFTINANGDQVFFSQGNLQYIGSAATPYWKFADNQWDILGTTTGQNSTNSNVDRDLFGWGTSGYHDSDDTYNVNYQPWSTSAEIVNYNYNFFGYGPSTNAASPDLTGSSANYDWGVYNAISNGGNQAGQWRTLTGDYNGEWYYVFRTRDTSSGIRYAMAQVAGVNGVILLPDDWSPSTYSLSSTDTFSSNTISASQWTTLENAGAVFLPAAGERGEGCNVYDHYSHGNYWSSSCGIGIGHACYVSFGSSSLTSLSFGSDGNRCTGRSIRLVCPVVN